MRHLGAVFPAVRPFSWPVVLMPLGGHAYHCITTRRNGPSLADEEILDKNGSRVSTVAASIAFQCLRRFWARLRRLLDILLNGLSCAGNGTKNPCRPQSQPPKARQKLSYDLLKCAVSRPLRAQICSWLRTASTAVQPTTRATPSTAAKQKKAGEFCGKSRSKANRASVLRLRGNVCEEARKGLTVPSCVSASQLNLIRCSGALFTDKTMLRSPSDASRLPASSLIVTTAPPPSLRHNSRPEPPYTAWR
jgi:hypothetical protein